MKCNVIVMMLCLIVVFVGKSTIDLQVRKELTKEKMAMKKINLVIEDQTFTVILEDHATTQEFLTLLPMTLTMQELNQNEKYAEITKPLPVAAKVPTQMHAGDIMLFGTSTLVLFYKDFTTTYAYTPIGHVKEVEIFISMVGTADVEVTFLKSVI